VITGCPSAVGSFFADHVERELAPNGALETVRGLANKLPEHAARLAADLTLVRNVDAGEVACEEMEAGIALAEHYAAEALRLFGVRRINADLRLAQRLLNWLVNQWAEPKVSLPDISASTRLATRRRRPSWSAFLRITAGSFESIRARWWPGNVAATRG